MTTDKHEIADKIYQECEKRAETHSVQGRLSLDEIKRIIEAVKAEEKPQAQSVGAEAELKMLVPMSKYNQLQHIARNISEYLKHPIEQLEEQLKDVHNQLHRAYESEKKWKDMYRDLEKKFTDQPQQPTAKEMLEALIEYYDNNKRWFLSSSRRSGVEYKGLTGIALLEFAEQWLKEKTKER